MSMIDRGVKRRCASCEAPFYDMGRTPIVCPKCGAHFEAGSKRLVSVPRPPKGRPSKGGFPTATPKAGAEDAPKPGRDEDDADELESEDLDAAEEEDEIEDEAADDSAEDSAEEDGGDKASDDR